MSNTHDLQGRQIEEFTYEELSSFPLSANCEEFVIRNKEGIKDYVVPSLRSALEIAKSKSLKVKVELKGANCEELCIALIKELDIEHLISFSSFMHSRLKTIRELHPTIPTGALFSGNVPTNYLDICNAIGATEVHLRFDTCTTERVTRKSQIRIENNGVVPWSYYNEYHVW